MVMCREGMGGGGGLEGWEGGIYQLRAMHLKKNIDIRNT